MSADRKELMTERCERIEETDTLRVELKEEMETLRVELKAFSTDGDHRLSSVMEPLGRGFWGRCRWLLVGR